MNSFLTYIRTRLLAFIPTLIGIIEVALKFIKEAITLIVNILFPIIPVAGFKVIVTKIRSIIDIASDWLSKNKEKILAILKLI